MQVAACARRAIILKKTSRKRSRSTCGAEPPKRITIFNVFLFIFGQFGSQNRTKIDRESLKTHFETKVNEKNDQEEQQQANKSAKMVILSAKSDFYCYIPPVNLT